MNVTCDFSTHPAATSLATKRPWSHGLTLAALAFHYECRLASRLIGMQAGMVLSFGGWNFSVFVASEMVGGLVNCSRPVR